MERHGQPSVPVASTTTLKTLVDLLKKRITLHDQLKKEHDRLKHQYKTLNQPFLHLKCSLLLCEKCRQPDELYNNCDARWKKY